MAENLKLVSDLALILISAGITTIIFKLLRQPLVLGYIVAGFLVGPHLNIFPTVADTANIEVWSEIGIIFLLFGLGLEFSFKKLFTVGSKAFVTALLEIVAMIAVGVLLGFIMGWGLMESIFLGGMLAMSSTTIIIKAFEDMNLKNEPFVDLTMVVLIIQDVVAVVMMVLLSTAAASKQTAGMEMLMSIVKLVFFLILWFVVGIYIIPSFFKRAKKYINDETLLIISIGLCFGMVILANNVGFSSALGAFVIGSILSETIESERIIDLTKSIKELFDSVASGYYTGYQGFGFIVSGFGGGSFIGGFVENRLYFVAGRRVRFHHRLCRRHVGGYAQVYLSSGYCGISDNHVHNAILD